MPKLVRPRLAGTEVGVPLTLLGAFTVHKAHSQVARSHSDRHAAAQLELKHAEEAAAADPSDPYLQAQLATAQAKAHHHQSHRLKALEGQRDAAEARVALHPKGSAERAAAERGQTSSPSGCTGADFQDTTDLAHANDAVRAHHHAHPTRGHHHREKIAGGFSKSTTVLRPITLTSSCHRSRGGRYVQDERFRNPSSSKEASEFNALWSLTADSLTSVRCLSRNRSSCASAPSPLETIGHPGRGESGRGCRPPVASRRSGAGASRARSRQASPPSAQGKACASCCGEGKKRR